MPESTTALYGTERAEPRVSTAQLLGQVSFLVAVALAFCAVGTYVGRDLAIGTARILSFAGLGMLLLGSFAGARFRTGAFAIGWLYATALMIGLGLGPVIKYFATVDQAAITNAAGGTALVVVGMGALGFVLARDLARWMRPLSLIVLGAVVVSIGLFVFGSAGNPVLSVVIGLASAALIAVDFNYLRKHGTEDDAVWLATGIFVSILNIFLSLLNLFSR